jgi:arabinofuranosyltransferase
MVNGEKDIERSLILLLVFIFILILPRTAWLCDDAFITFRTVDNFIEGHGLVYNVGERVQTYTHPLWMFLISFFYFLTGEIYFTPIMVSILLSIVAVIFFTFKIAETRINAILGLIVLIFSRAFIDYSTSGLENPLTHLLLALFCWTFLKKGMASPTYYGVGSEKKPGEEEKVCKKEINKKTILILSTYGSLLLVNRMDLILFVAPTLGYTCFLSIKSKTLGWVKCLKTVALGLIPFILWELFSLFYYGFLFPNTAYAKLNTGIARKDLVEQGFYYLLHSIHFDPLTILVIIWSLALVFCSKPRNKRYIALAIGIILYLFYIVLIGGDFMSGRFLTPVLFAAVMILPPIHGKIRFQSLAIAGLIIIIGFCSEHPPLMTGENYGVHQSREKMLGLQGICDERAYYYGSTGLLRVSRESNMKTAIRDHIWEIQENFKCKENIYCVGVIGFFGFFVGPKAHICDILGLADPLLARLNVDRQWRIGHFRRSLPDGYIDTLYSGENKIKDKHLALYYDKISVITRGQLFSLRRLKEIWLMNWGYYNHLVDKYNNRHFNVLASALSKPKSERTPWNADGNIIMGERGIWIDFETYCQPKYIEISVDQNDVYRILYFNQDREIASQLIRKKRKLKGGLAVHRLEVPIAAKKMKFNKIRLYPEQGDGKYSIGHLTLID